MFEASAAARKKASVTANNRAETMVPTARSRLIAMQRMANRLAPRLGPCRESRVARRTQWTTANPASPRHSLPSSRGQCPAWSLRPRMRLRAQALSPAGAQRSTIGTSLGRSCTHPRVEPPVYCITPRLSAPRPTRTPADIEGIKGWDEEKMTWEWQGVVLWQQGPAGNNRPGFRRIQYGSSRGS